jgi:hypothetical protein
MDKHHLLISGTGRAGTTFLVQLLTEIGLDTGFLSINENIHASCNAGMEWNISDIYEGNAPYVVKGPELCEHISKILETPGVTIDCMIIPIRDLYDSAESRRKNLRQSKNRKAPGALWLTKNPKKQEQALAISFHHLVHYLTKYDIPMVLVHFPRIVRDPEYLYNKLGPWLSGKSYEEFLRAFKAISRPELVNEFNSKAFTEKPFFWRLKKALGFKF